MKEEWRDVVGFEGFYEVSNHGRVRSVSREIFSRNRASKYTMPSKIRKLRSDAYGYLILDLFVDRKSTTVKVHRLVAQSFIEKKSDDGDEVDHKDGDRKHNHISNLRWATSSQNNINRHKVWASSGLMNIRLRNDRPRPRPWQVYHAIGGKFKSLGHFSTSDEAVKARDVYFKELEYGRTR